MPPCKESGKQDNNKNSQNSSIAQQHAKDGCQFIAKWLQKPARDSIACFMTVDLKTMHSIPDEFNSEIQTPKP